MQESSIKESHLQDAIRLALGRDPEVAFFRNNIGHAVMTRGGRVTFGVGGPGGADLIGMILGRFAALEVKTPTGRQSPEQRQFQALVESKGGIYLLARSVDDAVAMVAQTKERMR